MSISAVARLGRHVATAAALLTAVAVASAGPAWTAPSHVLPPKAAPHGYSLAEMGAATADFSFNLNDPADYPDTPFQILYIDDVDIQIGNDGGVVATAENSFTVAPGTPLYVPIFNVTDDAPVFGQFPTSPGQAADYFFGPSQYGAQGFEIIVDGVATPIGVEYLRGPFPAGDGSHIITLAAFVGPLSPGTHTVVVRGGVFGPAAEATHGVTYIHETLTYTVHVVPAS